MIKRFIEAKCINGEKQPCKDTFLVMVLTKLLKEILDDDNLMDHGEIQAGGSKN